MFGVERFRGLGFRGADLANWTKTFPQIIGEHMANTSD